MPKDDSKRTKDDTKSRMDQSVPRPDPDHRLTEDQKRAIELEGEVEHATGKQREEIIERSQEKLPPGKNP